MKPATVRAHPPQDSTVRGQSSRQMRDVFNQTSVLLQPHIISLQDRDRNSATAPSIAHSPLLQRHWTLDPHARPGSVHMASLRPSPSCERIHTSPSGAYMTMSAVKKMSKTPPPPLRMRKQATPPLPDPTMLRDSEPILSGAMKYELALDEFVGAVRSFSTLVTTATPASDVVGTVEHPFCDKPRNLKLMALIAQLAPLCTIFNPNGHEWSRLTKGHQRP